MSPGIACFFLLSSNVRTAFGQGKKQSGLLAAFAPERTDTIGTINNLGKAIQAKAKQRQARHHAHGLREGQLDNEGITDFN